MSIVESKAIVNESQWSNELVFYLNGQRVAVQNPEPEMTLLTYIRTKAKLTGSKLGCGEGGCGACTVMISSYDVESKKISHRAINACLAPLSVAGQHVVTVEGLGSIKSGLHPVQQRMAEFHASQCGFCTPGIVMAMYTFFRNHPNATLEEVEEAMDGNLCRCTGYRPILDAAKSLAQDNKRLAQIMEHEEKEAKLHVPAIIASTAQELASSIDTKPNSSDSGDCGGSGGCGMGDQCCKNQKPETKEQEAPHKIVQSSTASKISQYEPYAPAGSELIFPPALMKYTAPEQRFESGVCTWFSPATLQSMLALKAKYPAAKIVVGNTEVGIETKFKNLKYPYFIGAGRVPELNKIEPRADGIEFGSSVSLTNMKLALQDAATTFKDAEPHKRQTINAFLAQLRWFSSTQIRNAACIAGNIVTASPISDLNPLFQAVNARLTLQALGEEPRTVSARDFFLDYRKVDLRPNEVLLSVFLPFSRPLEFVQSYKQSKRREDDIAIVSNGSRVHLEKRGNDYVVKDLTLSYGGMNKITVCAPKTAEYFQGKVWNEETLKGAYGVLAEDLPLAPGTPGGMVEYRRTLCASFLFKFFLHVNLSLCQAENSPAVPADAKSAAVQFHRPISSGAQLYQVPEDPNTVVGSDRQHMSGQAHTTGEAIYADDMPDIHGMTHCALVVSTKAHAEIVSMDFSLAEKADGVVGIVTAKDVPGDNMIGDIFHDEELLATRFVYHVGQVVAVVVADTQVKAQRAAQLVKIEYKELPAILSIEDAMEKNSFQGPTHVVETGDVKAAFAEGDLVVVEGDMKIGGQEHFYLETNACVAQPMEQGEFIVHASTQNPSKTQDYLAQVLNVPSNHVVCKVKRMGGGFGGKETRTMHHSCFAALSAHKFKRPSRLCLDRDMDMLNTGARHPFYARYKASCSRDGKLHALDVKLFANGGYSFDLSGPVLDRALLHIDNTYRWPNLRAEGRVALTHLPSNTAFRGFGGPQGMMVAEVVVEHLARKAGIDQAAFREKNLYREGDATPYGQKLENFTLGKTWHELKERLDMPKLQANIGEFNAGNRYRKRGLALTPVKFGISFTATFLNQGGALVLVYKDGSVLISHGGTEMGQGLHTKMCQIAASALGVPLEKVHCSETATDKVANTSATAASFSSDLNGYAVLDACQQIKGRLQPLFDKHPSKTWDEIVKMAYFERVDLCAHGFHKVPDVWMDWEHGRGHPFRYYTSGSAASVVEVDVLTGDFQVLSTDIVMDLGRSLNPIIDVGQIEGAFAQGMGWCTMEELVFGNKHFPWIQPGSLFTRGPGAYKIPGFNDVPIRFNIHLLKDTPNPHAVYSSKAVGEPPLFLAASVFFAIKEALLAARVQNGLSNEYFHVDSPATCERIRMASPDQMTSQFTQDPAFRPKINC